ncbi:MAG: hypothetical protein GWN84_14815 [Gammaproteobacteria bacterium]|nr:hypothetical protein [Gammaproteobacteria bacterium]NIR84071.1 hypothetical protein [Gammaproteobacteria bacterium]NIR89215.1 hypothetical protein [Gammaproteobacteria bacterium]NIU05017.1 hypothetical protein [Gammaproteobacteria bacterium]NIV52183.1 hypothetical protein [Gammaproteobacteria bacterium]
MNASRSALRLSLASMLLAASLPLAAVHEPGHRVVDGMSIFIGVMPAQAIAKRGGVEATMHGGAGGAHSYHVMVALFDHADGQRITDARVTATVGEIGMAKESEPLEPMHAGGVVTYGNYFTLPRAGLYRIRIEIHVPGESRSVRTWFDYRVQRDR